MTVTCCSLLLRIVRLRVILVPLLFTLVLFICASPLVLFICASPKPTYGVGAYPQPNPRVIGAA